MNKHSQIKNIIGTHKLYHDLDNFWFQTETTIITSTTWASVQESATGEVLDVLMKFRIRKSTLESDDEQLVDPVSVDDRFHDLVEDDFTNFEPYRRDNDDAMQESAPVILPFLAWKIKDDLDDLSTPIVTDQLLETIYSSLPAVCIENWADHTDDLAGVGNSTESRLSTRSKTPIIGKTAKEVTDVPYPLHDSCDMSGCQVGNRFYMEMKTLFEYFVPKEHNPNTAAVQIYWGAVYELLGSLARPYGSERFPTTFHDNHRDLDELNKRVEEINIRAKALHLGVYYKRSVLSSCGEVNQHDAISESARLLASIIDALGAIFNMIVQAVCEVRNGLKNWKGKPVWMKARGSKMLRYARNACNLLETARDELIADSTGFSPDENIGPVLTPQAVLILLIERLVGGVYGSGSVDIMAVFDECLAQLVSPIVR